MKFTKMRLEHAIQSFSQISLLLQNKRVVLFLDFDGTLSPIQADPSACHLPSSSEGARALKQASESFYTTILTGRWVMGC
jgi:trehalose 6-phosphate phosphatase